jgi:hypothetical protein
MDGPKTDELQQNAVLRQVAGRLKPLVAELSLQTGSEGHRSVRMSKPKQEGNRSCLRPRISGLRACIPMSQRRYPGRYRLAQRKKDSALVQLVVELLPGTTLWWLP